MHRGTRRYKATHLDNAQAHSKCTHESAHAPAHARNWTSPLLKEQAHCDEKYIETAPCTYVQTTNTHIHSLSKRNKHTCTQACTHLQNTNKHTCAHVTFLLKERMHAAHNAAIRLRFVNAKANIHNDILQPFLQHAHEDRKRYSDRITSLNCENIKIHKGRKRFQNQKKKKIIKK